MVDYEKRETVTLKELMPNWWGKERYAEGKAFRFPVIHLNVVVNQVIVFAWIHLHVHLTAFLTFDLRSNFSQVQLSFLHLIRDFLLVYP